MGQTAVADGTYDNPAAETLTPPAAGTQPATSTQVPTVTVNDTSTAVPLVTPTDPAPSAGTGTPAPAPVPDPAPAPVAAHPAPSAAPVTQAPIDDGTYRNVADTAVTAPSVAPGPNPSAAPDPVGNRVLTGGGPDQPGAASSSASGAMSVSTETSKPSAGASSGSASSAAPPSTVVTPSAKQSAGVSAGPAGRPDELVTMQTQAVTTTAAASTKRVAKSITQTPGPGPGPRLTGAPNFSLAPANIATPDPLSAMQANEARTRVAKAATAGRGSAWRAQAKPAFLMAPKVAPDSQLLPPSFGVGAGSPGTGILEVLANYVFPGASPNSTGALLLLFPLALLLAALTPRIPRLHLQTIVAERGSGCVGFNPVQLRPG